MALELTEKAAEEIKSIADKEKLDLDRIYLKVGVKGGGCSGFSYILDLTDKKSDDDHQWNRHEINIICDQRSHLYLDGTTIDFRDEMMGRAFVFNNPNATTTCGCGSSFAV
jgi:iron-sulfur cluster assembly protein